MEEDIEILEDNKDMFIDTLYECYRQSAVKPFEKALENLINRVKELEKENSKMKADNLLKLNKEINKNIQVAYGGRRYNTEGIIIEDYIPKSKIKEKMEEISGMAEVGDIEREIYNRAEYAIEILLELLEE